MIIVVVASDPVLNVLHPELNLDFNYEPIMSQPYYLAAAQLFLSGPR
jgi:hypothetical protein